MENGGPAGAEAAGILEAGTRVGKYEIRRLIGLGSMSAIYEGARPDTGRRVALKVLSPKRAGVPGARARFLTEAKLTARVRHAHIVDVIEVGEDGERSYLAMEMLEGEDLAARLRHAGFLSAAETADILVPVCEAVAAAHESGIVHRDLKPANIFLAIRDQKIHPVVLDFGIANDNDDDAGAVSGLRLVFGTPYYLSPEQIADHRAASPASDQWALGVILYECLTGARPYDGASLDDVFAAIRAGHALPPSERRRGISTELGQVVMRAMSSEPSARFASVTELAQALRPFRSGLGAASASSRRRALSSPAIAAEASTQSPFTRTLTPEVDVLDGLWFEPDPAEETSGDATLPSAGLLSAEEPDADAQRPLSSEAWLTFANRWTDKWRSVSGRRFSGRRISGRRISGRRVGAVAGGALGGLALLLLLFTHGSAKRAGSPQPATVTDRAIEPSPGVPMEPPGGQAIAPPREPEKENPAAKEAVIIKEPAVAKSPSVVEVKEPVAPKEPVMAKEPAVAKSPSVVEVKEPAAPKEPVVAKEPAAPKEPVGKKHPAPVKERVAVKEPTVVEHVAKPQATPAAIRPPKAERHERVAPAPIQTPTASGAAPRDTAERPRARTGPDVRMHNGVPLLD
jgi:serine/threonine protein kinase